jgi:hypothetical protein
MILPKDNQDFEAMQMLYKELAPLTDFFIEDKERFVLHFVQEIKREKGVKTIRAKELLATLLKIHRALFDFKRPIPHKVEEELLYLIRKEIHIAQVLRRVLASMQVRLIKAYREDPLLMQYLAHLNTYFQNTFEYLEELAENYHTCHIGGYGERLSYKAVERWFQKDRIVQLFNMYKGISIRYKGVVIENEGTRIRLQVPLKKGVVAEWEGQTIMYESALEPKSIQLTVHHVTYDEQWAYLEITAFKWIESFIERRKQVRVKFDQPLRARIVALGRQFDVDVMDLSTHGICLQTDVHYGLPISERIEVMLPIPQKSGYKRKLLLRGALKYISTSSDGRRRYHIFLYPTVRKEQILSAFIGQRQLSLLQEIQELAKERLAQSSS